MHFIVDNILIILFFFTVYVFYVHKYMIKILIQIYTLAIVSIFIFSVLNYQQRIDPVRSFLEFQMFRFLARRVTSSSELEINIEKNCPHS